MSPFAIRKHFIFLELVCHCPSSFLMKFIFHIFLRGITGENFMEKKFRSNDFEYIAIDSVFCADFKYEICLKMNIDHSVQNSLNISQKCQKSGIENKLLRV